VFVGIAGVEVLLFVELTECENGDCPCCAPAACCGDCHFPVSETACEEPFPETELGGATQIVNFRTEYSVSPALCDGEKSAFVDAQDGVSTHLITCEDACAGTGEPKLVARSRCSFTVPMLFESCDEPTSGVYAIVYTGSGVWTVASGGVGALFWNEGRTSYEGDCDGAVVEGTFTLGGFTYTYRSSFEVTRDMPDVIPECPCFDGIDMEGNPIPVFGLCPPEDGV
jgi:hypothetical protein